MVFFVSGKLQKFRSFLEPKEKQAQLRTTENNSWSQLLSKILSVNTLTWIFLNFSCFSHSNIKSWYIILKCKKKQCSCRIFNASVARVIPTWQEHMSSWDGYILFVKKMITKTLFWMIFWCQINSNNFGFVIFFEIKYTAG